MINKTNNDCETTLCYYETAARPNFFHGMLLTDEHLRAQQDYHRQALKRVNRHLWGSGVVCGLTVELKDLCVKINAGVAIDCCGNLIEVCKCITLDLSKECEKKFGPNCPPPQPQGNAELKIKKYLVLRYMEREIDPEPVLTPDTDCEPASGKSKCSASKVQEGFCIELWDKCPCPHKDPVVVKDLLTTLREAGEHQNLVIANQIQSGASPAQGTATGTQGPVPPPPESKDCTDLPLPCSDCGCCESAVALAVLEINCTKKTIARNIECDCRHYVMSPRMLSWLFSMVRPKLIATEVATISARIGDRSSSNMLASAMTFEAAGATPVATQAAAAPATAKVDSMNNKITRMNAKITKLENLAKELQKQVTSQATPATPPVNAP
jgi:hypothetical protein